MALVVRSIFFWATHYSILPYGDTYGEYGTMRSFFNVAKVFSIPTAPQYAAIPAQTLNVYSSWPALPILGMQISLICNIDNFTVALLLPWAYLVICLLFLYLIMKLLIDRFNLNIWVFIIALVMAVFSPLFYMLPLFIHSFAGPVILSILFYLIGKSFPDISVNSVILIILFLISLVVTHHHTSVVFTLYMFFTGLFIYVFIYVYKNIKNNKSIPSVKYSVFLNLGLVAAAIIYVWWNYSTGQIWSYVGTGIIRFIKFIREINFELYTFQGYMTSIPAILSPDWALLLLLIRNITMYVSILFGLFLLFKHKADIRFKILLISSIVFGLAILVIDSTVFWMGPFRALYLFMPFFAVCSALLYETIRVRLKAFGNYLIGFILFIWMFSAFIGLWATVRYVPLHLYDPAVSFNDAGEHPMGWQNLKPFFSSKMDYANVDSIISDETYTLSLLLPQDQWNKARVLGQMGSQISPKSLIVILTNFNVLNSYMTQGYKRDSDINYNESDFKYKLDSDCNQIYSDNNFQVWYNW